MKAKELIRKMEDTFENDKKIKKKIEKEIFELYFYPHEYSLEVMLMDILPYRKTAMHYGVISEKMKKKYKKIINSQNGFYIMYNSVPDNNSDCLRLMDSLNGIKFLKLLDDDTEIQMIPLG